MLASIDANQLRQIEFLQRCFVSESLDGELADFCSDLAQGKDESLTDVKDKLCTASEMLGDLLRTRSQIRVQLEQAKVRINGLKRTYPFQVKVFKNSFRIIVRNKYQRTKVNFELELLSEAVQGINEQLCESYEIAADLIENYWNYFPVDSQESLLEWFRKLVEVLEVSENTSEDLSACALRLKNSICRAAETGKSKSNFQLSQVRNNSVSNATRETALPEKSLPAAQKRKYTLEELVAGVTPENSHEVTDWGNPVGEEVW